MPPKSKKRVLKTTTEREEAMPSKKNKSNKTQENEIQRLVQLLPRSRLEALVANAVIQGKELSITDLERVLPKQDEWKLKRDPSAAAAVVGTGPSRQGTGSFDAVDDLIVYGIFQALSLQERIACVSSVCKAWRDFKTLFPALFMDLSLSMSKSTNRAGSSLTGGNVKQTLGLINWIPEPANVFGLKISTSKGCDGRECKAVARTLGMHKMRSTNAPPLTKLVLEGPKITSAVINDIFSKRSGLVPSSLVSLTVTDIQDSKVNNGCILELLRNMPALEELTLPPCLFRSVSLTQHLQALSSARSNEPTLLRFLDLTGWSWGRTISYQEFVTIATLCPELEVLRMESMGGAPSQRLTPFKDDGSLPRFLEDTTTATLGLFSSPPLVTFPRLREFQLKKMCDASYGYLVTDVARAIISWLLEFMPSVEDVSLDSGPPYLSNKDAKIYKVPDLPGVGGSLAPLLPASIRTLELCYFAIEADAFQGVHLPNLEKVALRMCGPSMPTMARSLHQQFQGLVVGHQVAGSYRYGNRNGSAGQCTSVCIAKVLPKAFQELKVNLDN